MPTLAIDEVQRRKLFDTAMRLSKEAMTRAAQATLDCAPDAVQLAEHALVLLKRADRARALCEQQSVKADAMGAALHSGPRGKPWGYLRVLREDNSRPGLSPAWFKLA